eukprot:SAG22_NODE_16_length_32723_cov_26.404825_27_plen_746_part_00
MGGGHRLGKIAGHVMVPCPGTAAAPPVAADGAAAAAAAAVVFAAPWLAAAGIGAGWALWPAVVGAVKTVLSNSGSGGGTYLTPQMLADMAATCGAGSMPIGHPRRGAAGRFVRHRHPDTAASAAENDSIVVPSTSRVVSLPEHVVSPKQAGVVAIPGAAEPEQLAVRLALSKVLSERLAAASPLAALPWDLVEKVGAESLHSASPLWFDRFATVAKADPKNWISDGAGVLDEVAFGEINRAANALHTQFGIEAVVVTVPGTRLAATGYGDLDGVHDFAVSLFDEWQVGRAGANTGLLVLYSASDRAVETVTGAGMLAVLPDAEILQVVERCIIPAFRRGQFSAGLLGGVREIHDRVTAKVTAKVGAGGGVIDFSPAKGTAEDFGGGQAAGGPRKPLVPALAVAAAAAKTYYSNKYRCGACGRHRLLEFGPVRDPARNRVVAAHAGTGALASLEPLRPELAQAAWAEPLATALDARGPEAEISARELRQLVSGEATVMLLTAVITAFPSVSLPFLAVPLLSQPTVALSGARQRCQQPRLGDRARPRAAAGGGGRADAAGRARGQPLGQAVLEDRPRGPEAGGRLAQGGQPGRPADAVKAGRARRDDGLGCGRRRPGPGWPELLRAGRAVAGPRLHRLWAHRAPVGRPRRGRAPLAGPGDADRAQPGVPGGRLPHRHSLRRLRLRAVRRFPEAAAARRPPRPPRLPAVLLQLRALLRQLPEQRQLALVGWPRRQHRPPRRRRRRRRL